MQDFYVILISNQNVLLGEDGLFAEEAWLFEGCEKVLN